VIHRSLLAVAIAALTVAAAAQDKITVYKNARIWPGGATPIDNGVLIVQQGKVQAVGGASTPVPAGAVVVDLAGRQITPGLVDAGWQAGASLNDRNEQATEVTPQAHVLDALDPQDRAFARARRCGVTAVQVSPGNRNVIGGLGAVVKTAGATPAAMLLKDESSLRIAMGSEPSGGNRAIRGGNVDSIYYRRPTTRMGVVWEVRKAFFAAKDYQQRTIAGSPPPVDPGMAVLVRALKQELVVFTTARAEQDIRTALRLATEFGYRTVIDEAQEAHLVLDELAASKAWVLVGAPSADRTAGAAANDQADPRWSTLGALAKAGIPFVITTGSNPLALDLGREALFAVRFGLSPQDALDAVTLRPAIVLGVDNRIGSLAAGKDADFVIWSTDPFDPTAAVQAVHCNGLRVDE
jgi:imidazolonepropionase-like amidohydrolase